jgi:hypothetical protein
VPRRRGRTTRRSLLPSLTLVFACTATGCTYSTADPSPSSTGTLAPLRPTPTPTPAAPGTATAGTTAPSTTVAVRRRPARVVLRPARVAVRVLERRNAAALAVATSRALVASTPAVVVTAEGRRDERRATAAATTLRVPLLLASPPAARAVAAEVRRLGARTVLGFGRLPRELTRGLRSEVKIVRRLRDVPRVRRATPAATGAFLVSRGDPATWTAIVTARVAGLRTVVVAGGDPRAARGSQRALHRLSPSRIVAAGRPGTFPAPSVLGGLARTAAGGKVLPGGGQLLFPGRRIVAIYGHPGDGNLGVLGEQGVNAAVRRARRVARPYRRAGGATVVPGLEVIATVASAEAGPDGDFSLESSVDHLRPWVDAAAAAGLYVVLDLQPGHTDFPTQARRYEELLAQPHVGLALDPEWRLAPGQRHLVDIGSVRAAEVNRVAAWLARLTRRHALPQKLLIVHQFRLDMIRHRDQIRRRPELAVVLQMDGLGPQAVKLSTWAAVTADGPPGARFGWKNFYDEDRPVRSPAATIALRPSPVFVSYQ